LVFVGDIQLFEGLLNVQIYHDLIKKSCKSLEIGWLWFDSFYCKFWRHWNTSLCYTITTWSGSPGI